MTQPIQSRIMDRAGLITSTKTISFDPFISLKKYSAKFDP